MGFDSIQVKTSTLSCFGVDQRNHMSRALSCIFGRLSTPWKPNSLQNFNSLVTVRPTFMTISPRINFPADSLTAQMTPQVFSKSFGKSFGNLARDFSMYLYIWPQSLFRCSLETPNVGSNQGDYHTLRQQGFSHEKKESPRAGLNPNLHERLRKSGIGGGFEDR